MPSTAHPSALALPKQPSQSEIDSTASLMAQTMDLVRLQLRRIRKDVVFHEDAMTRGKAEDIADSRMALFADVHYMLISLHNVEQLFSKLKKLTPHEVELTDVRNKYRKWLRNCGEFRGLIDHSDGRPATRAVGAGRLDKGSFCLDGLSLEIGPPLEKEIEDYFRDLTSAWAKISDRQKRLRELITSRPGHAS